MCRFLYVSILVCVVSCMCRFLRLSIDASLLQAFHAIAHYRLIPHWHFVGKLTITLSEFLTAGKIV